MVNQLDFVNPDLKLLLSNIKKCLDADIDAYRIQHFPTLIECVENGIDAAILTILTNTEIDEIATRTKTTQSITKL